MHMRRSAVIILIILLYILPFALVVGGVVSVELRRLLYVIGGIVAFIFTRHARLSWRDFGFRLDNARAALLPYAAFAVLGAAGIVAVALASGRVPRAEWWLAPHFRYGLLIPVSAAQEFFYRGMLMPMLAVVTQRRWLVVLLNAALFTFLHIIFPDSAIVLPLAFLGGLVFAALWLRWSNIWLASATHIVLNAAFTMFCYGGFVRSCVHS